MGTRHRVPQPLPVDRGPCATPAAWRRPLLPPVGGLFATLGARRRRSLPQPPRALQAQFV